MKPFPKKATNGVAAKRLCLQLMNCGRGVQPCSALYRILIKRFAAVTKKLIKYRQKRNLLIAITL